MEVYGLKNLLERIVGKIVMSEIVTDASSAVIALVRKMKGIKNYFLYLQYQYQFVVINM